MGVARKFVKSARSPPTLPAHQSYKSALVFVPTIDAKIEELRKRHDKRFDRWMPHVTVVFPFVPEDYSENGGVSDVVSKVDKAISQIPRVPINFKQLGHFTHNKNSHTLYLSPDENATKTLQHIVHNLADALPEYDEIRRKGSFTPHVTLGQFRSLVELEQVREMVKDHFAESEQSTGVLAELSWVTRRGYADRMSVKKTFPLAVSDDEAQDSV